MHSLCAESHTSFPTRRLQFAHRLSPIASAMPRHFRLSGERWSRIEEELSVGMDILEILLSWMEDSRAPRAERRAPTALYAQVSIRAAADVVSPLPEARARAVARQLWKTAPQPENFVWETSHSKNSALVSSSAASARSSSFSETMANGTSLMGCVSTRQLQVMVRRHHASVTGGEVFGFWSSRNDPPQAR
jgi:hypothetical protein